MSRLWHYEEQVRARRGRQGIWVKVQYGRGRCGRVAVYPPQRDPDALTRAWAAWRLLGDAA